MHDTLFQRLRGELRPKEYDGDSFWYYRDIFSRLPVLETQRLLLRPLKMSDCQDVFAYSRDPEVARHVLWDAHQTAKPADTCAIFCANTATVTPAVMVLCSKTRGMS